MKQEIEKNCYIDAKVKNWQELEDFDIDLGTSGGKQTDTVSIDNNDQEPPKNRQRIQQ